MNAKQIIAAAVVFAATGSAFAQQTEFQETTRHVSTKTRAEVKAELKQASQNGTLAQRDGQDTVVAVGTRSREEVRAEATLASKGDFVNSLYFGA